MQRNVLQVCYSQLTFTFAVLCSSVLLPQTFADAQDKQTAPGNRLTVERLFGGGEFGEERLGVWQWSKRSSSYFTFVSGKNRKDGRDLVRVDCQSGEQSVVVAAAEFMPAGSEEPLGVDSVEFSDDESKLLIYTNSRRVWRRNTRGDYWLLDLTTKKLKRIGGDAAPSTLMFAKFAPNGRSVAYVRENNIYVQDLETEQIQALTHDGSANVINGTSDWVNEEELDIRDAFRWSPDSSSIAYWQFDTSGVPIFTMIDNTSEKYSKPIQFPYPKVGQRNSACRVGIATIASKETKWIDVPGDSREHYIARMEWIPNSNELILQQFNRLQNVNRVMRVSSDESRTIREILAERDEAWLENENPVRWIKPGKELLWISERDGWRHAYRMEIESGKLECLTPGDFDVIAIEALDSGGEWLYYSASPDNPTQRYLYRVSLASGSTERLSPADQPGWHTYDFSADTKFATHTYSSYSVPPTIELVQLSDLANVRTLVTNERIREKLAKLDMPIIEFFKVDGADGTALDGWSLKPPQFDAAKKYPLLMHVYGEPHGQTVRDSWMGTRGLWHWMLAQQGYIVASIDNRGTMSPRGRKWRKCVHRQIGSLASLDQAAATQSMLNRWPFADRNRVGIWGWSGGGSMSLNMLFRYPELFHMAIAVAPVPDQQLYDTIYQERYMGLPDDNAEGYRHGSPLTYAKQMQGDLLVIHGTGDDNCHYQGVELLMNELIANNKQFSIMPYPGRSHSISEGRNTAKHFYSLMTDYFGKHLMQRSNAKQTEVHTNASFEGSTGDSNGKTENAKSDTNKRWSTRQIEGWNVHIRKQLLSDNSKQVDRAVELLTAQLREIVRELPPTAVDQLRKVPLWISPEYPGIGPRAEYHPGRKWLEDNGRDPVMVKGVEFTNVRIFEAETRRMPNFALHELAHAYHDRVLGNDHREIKGAFERAKASGRYDRVQRQDSEGRKKLDRAYALSSPQEYFAETTEAYFSRNDFEPFDKAELEALDPAMYKLLHSLWGVQ